MPRSEVASQIEVIDSTLHGRCHCGAAAKWTVSLRLEGAQIKPAFQRADLCGQHAEQFAVSNRLTFPPSDVRVRHASKS